MSCSTRRFAGLDPLVVDRLKRDFYARLDALRLRETAAFYSAATRDLVTEMFPGGAVGRRDQAHGGFRRSFVDRHARSSTGWWTGSPPRSILTPARAISTSSWPRSSRRVAPRRAARGVDQLSRISVLGRADLPGHERARDRRVQRDPGGPHQPAGCPRVDAGSTGSRASKASASAILPRSCRAPTARTTICWAACMRSTG